MQMIKECKSPKGRKFTIIIDGNGGDAVLEKLGYKSEHTVYLDDRKQASKEALKRFVENAPRIEKMCEKCRKIFHPTIYQKKPKYCSKKCFFERNK